MSNETSVGTPLQAIRFAMMQGECRFFLEDWMHGDVEGWPEFKSFLENDNGPK